MPEHAGMAWTVPADYQSVHEMFRELQIGPYAYLRAPGLMALAQRYWPAIAILATVLAAWILYTVRVEHLVHKRTIELREAMARQEELARRARANQEQLEHLSRLSVLGELSGTLAHELNQPLAAISNYAMGCVRRLESGEYKEGDLLTAMQKASFQAERAGKIIRRIRDFVRKSEPRRSAVTLSEIVDDALGFAEIDAKKFADTVAAIGADTIAAIAEAGPATQAKLLQGLGIQSMLITDGTSPVNLFNTANGLVGGSAGGGAGMNMPALGA